MMWSKYVTRRLAVQVAQMWNFGWGEAMYNVYGVSLDKTLVFRDDKKTEYYVDKKQHNLYCKELYNLLEDADFLKRFHKDAQSAIEAILDQTKRKLDTDLSKLSCKELLEIYKKFIVPNGTKFYIRMWTVFNIGEPLANLVREELKKKVSDPDKYLLEFSSPLLPNDVINERIDLLKIAISKRAKGPLISKHTTKYMHIPMFDFDHEPYDKKHFMEQLEQIKDPERELYEIQNLFKTRNKDFENALKELNAGKRLERLLFFLKENVFLRDYRDMIRQKFNLELRKFYLETGKRIGLNIDEVAILTNEEIVSHLSKCEKFDRNLISERKRAYLLIQVKDKAKIYSGKKALVMARTMLDSGKNLGDTSIKGIVGSRGKKKGIAKIVFTNRDLKKIKQGDVLIATMTRQDFVPYMRKACAIVTDEGSVTCHAAIISRELKVPCIVAARNATKIFKDGDLVEVDAEKGVVRKI